MKNSDLQIISALIETSEHHTEFLIREHGHCKGCGRVLSENGGCELCKMCIKSGVEQL